MEIFELFGPGRFKQFDYLTAELIASLTNRFNAKDRVNKRCGQLFDAKYLKRYIPPSEPGTGSSQIAYLLAPKGAHELKICLIEQANQKHKRHSLGFRLGHKQLQGEVFIDPDAIPRLASPKSAPRKRN